MRVFLPFLFLACALQAQQGGVKSHVLPNGMKVLIQEDHGIPNVAMYLFYKIGARNERPGTTGVSHFFEHMMFNGAKKYGPKQFDNEMEKAGGNNNAYTTPDLTVYTDWFPSAALELMFDMEADRMQNLAFDPKIIDSERGVVYSERRTSVDNSNTGILYEQMRAAAFTAHPYHWPVVGWPSDIEGWTMEDLRSHYKTGYAPNNCVLVIVGDVTEQQVMALTKKYLEPIPQQPPPPAVRTKEPEQLGERRVTVRKQAQLPVQLVGYHVPDSKDKDSTVLEVIDALLTAGQSSRLYSRMVDRDQIALNVGGQASRSLDPGLFVFSMTPRSGIDPARTEKVLFEELEKLRTVPVEAMELQKAKNQLLAQQYRQMKTIAGRANLLGTYEIFRGDYNKLFTTDKDIGAVTAGDIQRVATKYFAEKNRTVATLIPEVK
jgi:zinc protease